MAKLRFTGLALALALTSCVSPKVEFASAFDYPEAQAYVDCAVDQARKRAFDNKEWYRNDDLDVPIMAGERACAATELELQMRAKADGMPESKLFSLSQELHKKTWRLAWDEVVRVRRERLKAMGAIG